jgi:hypothetical protein
MNNIIYKYPIQPHVLKGGQEVIMPVGARIIKVAEQDGNPCIWAEVDPYSASENRNFHVVFTGMTYNFDNLTYLDTCFVGNLVLHIYEESQ